MNVDSLELLSVGGDTARLASLLDGGCDPNVSHPVHGNTPLYNACFANRVEVVSLLLARGADEPPRVFQRLGYMSPATVAGVV